MKNLVVLPKVSEKAYELSQKLNAYIFVVPTNANRTDVKTAVSEQFNVTVTKVNIANSQGKVKRTVRKGGRPITGRRSDTKRAYVTLKAGDSIPVFAAEEDAKAEAAKTKAKTKEKK